MNLLWLVCTAEGEGVIGVSSHAIKRRGLRFPILIIRVRIAAPLELLPHYITPQQY